MSSGALSQAERRGCGVLPKDPKGQSSGIFLKGLQERVHSSDVSFHCRSPVHDGNSGSASAQGAATTPPELFTEAEEDAELLGLLFAEMDADKNGTVSHAELAAAVGKHGMQAELREVLESLLPSTGGFGASTGQREITREEFGKAFEKLPRVRGERVKWARGLGLEGLVARMLPRGEITDGLSGLRALPDAELPALAQRIAEELAAVLPGLIERKFRELRQSAAGESAALRHVNTKFALDGAFVGRFATLDDFHRGPEEHIGVPNPRIEEGVEAEHCRRSNRDVKFTTSNYNIVTWPSLEYEFVMAPKAGADYPHTPRDSRLWKNGTYSETNKQGWKGEHGRDPIALDAFLPDHPEAAALLAALPAGVQDFVLAARGVIKKAGLLRVEVACLRLYTGPLFTLYNAVLRGFPARDVAALLDNRYETSIFTITSGITKVSKISDVPPNRLLFRGCGGMILPRQFWDRYDECTVAVVILAHDKEAAASAVEAVERLLEKPSNAAPRASPAYDLDVQYLRLPAPIDDDALRAAADTGIRVASAPRQQESPASAALALAVPLEKLAFEARLSEALKAALSAACGGRAVVFERVAAKPQGFCGGGACHCAPRSAAPDMRKRRFPCSAPAPFPFSHAALPLHFPFPMRCSRSLSLFPCAAPAPFSFSHAPLPSPPPLSQGLTRRVRQSNSASCRPRRTGKRPQRTAAWSASAARCSRSRRARWTRAPPSASSQSTPGRPSSSCRPSPASRSPPLQSIPPHPCGYRARAHRLACGTRHAGAPDARMCACCSPCAGDGGAARREHAQGPGPASAPWLRS